MEQERLTIEIDRDLKNSLKADAASEGKTLKAYMLGGIEELRQLKAEHAAIKGQFTYDPRELFRLNERILALENKLNINPRGMPPPPVEGRM